MRSSGILLAIVCACAFVAPSLGAARAPPSGFVSLGRAPANSSTFILVAVTQPGAAAAESSCVAVADPDSPKFGQHLTVDEVADVLGARAASERVAAWLRGAGASDVSIVRTGDWVRANVPVYVLEKELRVRMERFSAITATGRVVHAARTLDEMTIPDHVAADIDFFVGVGDFPQLDLNTHKTATQRAAARAKVARADGGLDLIGLPVITDTTLYLALVGGCNSSPSPDDDSTCSIFDTPESFTMRITPFSKPSYDVVVPASEAVVGPSGLCFISTTEGILPFTFYNVSVRLNCSATSSSAWSDLPFKWDTLPSTYMGVAATPMMTPDYTHDFYGLSEETAGTNTLAHGVVEFVGQSFNKTMLIDYAKNYHIKLGETTVVGYNQPSQPGLEAQMDIELMMTVAPNVHTYFWGIAFNGSLTGAWILDWAVAMNDATSIPDVSSLSYGLPEIATCPSPNTAGLPCGNAYYSRTNTELVKLCTRGSSVVVCSQDAGATADGHGSNNCDLHPEFPATSPWVTTVGSTVPSNRAPARPNVDSIGEAAVSPADGTVWTTGGGFSSIPANARPSYQNTAVEKYLATAKNLPTGLFNASGRAYPDVAMVGSNYPIQAGGPILPLGDGTSSSTPIFSAAVTLLNQARAEAGKGPLGFLNIMLYKFAETHPEVFYDVTVGSNRCGEFLCCPHGYDTAVGFDAATGLGSIGDFSALRSLVVALP